MRNKMKMVRVTREISRPDRKDRSSYDIYSSESTVAIVTALAHMNREFLNSILSLFNSGILQRSLASFKTTKFVCDASIYITLDVLAAFRNMDNDQGTFFADGVEEILEKLQKTCRWT